MSKPTCLSAIRNAYPSLTAAEKKIANYITKNSAQIPTLSVSELAQKAAVASSAVIRCCKSLGFSGYSELKLSLVGELAKNKELNYMPYIYKDDTTGAILDKIFAASIKALYDTAEKLDRVALQSAVDRIGQAHIIYIYALGTSAGIAKEFAFRIMQLGYTVFFFNDIVEMRISTMNIQKGDLAIGISHSGRTIATIEALQMAAAQGADTLCITSYPGSPITKQCNCTVAVYSDEILYPVEAISARTAHLCVIDAISIALSATRYDESTERARRAHELINTIRYPGGKK